MKWVKTNIAVLFVLTSASCSKTPSPRLTGPDLIIRDVVSEFGPFDEITWSNDSLQSTHAYNKKVMERVGRVKNIIDKSLNQVGEEHKTSEAVTAMTGELGSYYTWETPLEKVELDENHKRDGSSLLKIFITRK